MKIKFKLLEPAGDEGSQGGAPAATETPAPAADAGPTSAVEAVEAGIANATEEGAPVAAADPAPAAEGEAALEPGAAGGESQEDKENREILAMYNGRGRDRVLKLHNEVKELRPLKIEVETLREKATLADEWEKTLGSTGITEEQFGENLQAMRGLNSMDPNAIAKAHEYYSKVAEDLGKRLGRGPAATLDADLQSDVESGALSAPRAKELQELRKRGELGQRHTQQVSQQTAQQNAVRQGAAAMDAIGNQMKANDPDYDRKMAYLKPTIRMIARTVQPAQWAAAFQEAYSDLPAMPAQQAAAPAAPRPGHMPLRPTGGNGAMKPEPKSAVEAMMMGIEAAQ